MFVSLGEEEEIPWADRMIKFLNVVENEYFIFFLEDYFLSQVPDVLEIEKRFKIMRNDLDIGKMDLSREVWKHQHLGIYKDTDLYIADNKNADYLMSFQPAIWRRDHFMRYLKSGENAWQSEVGMSKRASGSYEGLAVGNNTHCMPYVNAVLKGKANPLLNTIDDYDNVPGLKDLENFNIIL
jgi:hypothetical protein